MMAMTLTTESRTVYMCMSVRGGIRHLQGLRKKAKTYMTDDQGKPLSRDEAINAMMDELAKGHETIPLGPQCANPCPNAGKGCPGFDYGAAGGCGGFCPDDEQGQTKGSANTLNGGEDA